MADRIKTLEETSRQAEERSRQDKEALRQKDAEIERLRRENEQLKQGKWLEQVGCRFRSSSAQLTVGFFGIIWESQYLKALDPSLPTINHDRPWEAHRKDAQI
ncbi:hypothetical protein E4U13_005489 [Claviceps humidiphila]|uniref:Uncharacterized protein n=1 Tax=Claviceps humidiphila TaxID=1294629 RepID=A0A9P7TR46_9HYPO|nr:hypothetical protein E4U13_005489 [Claviceps humidiphila]